MGLPLQMTQVYKSRNKKISMCLNIIPILSNHHIDVKILFMFIAVYLVANISNIFMNEYIQPSFEV